MLQVGARGADEQGAIFASSLKRSSVDVKKLRIGRGITGTRPCSFRPPLHLCPALVLASGPRPSNHPRDCSWKRDSEALLSLAGDARTCMGVLPSQSHDKP